MSAANGTIRRSFTLSLDAELAEGLAMYMGEHSFPNQNEAVRAILRQYLAATPMDGALRAASQSAYNETRAWILRELTKFLHERSSDLQKALKPADQVPELKHLF